MPAINGLEIKKNILIAIQKVIYSVLLSVYRSVLNSRWQNNIEC